VKSLYPHSNRQRQESKAMAPVFDIRQTRIYQEALEEGVEQGVRNVAQRMLDLGKPIAEIVESTGLTEAQVRKLRKKPKK
jgi:predicted transposase/invertase (TIGR01784 family)